MWVWISRSFLFLFFVLIPCAKMVQLAEFANVVGCIHRASNFPGSEFYAIVFFLHIMTFYAWEKSDLARKNFKAIFLTIFNIIPKLF